MDGVVHFEIPVDDLERAKTFYGTVFDSELQSVPEMQYTTITTTPIDEQSMRPTTPGAINGGLMNRSKETPSPVITIGVDSVEEALKKVEAEGGTVITPSTPIPGMGAFGYFKDSEGNVMGCSSTPESARFRTTARGSFVPHHHGHRSLLVACHSRSAWRGRQGPPSARWTARGG